MIPRKNPSDSKLSMDFGYPIDLDIFFTIYTSLKILDRTTNILTLDGTFSLAGGAIACVLINSISENISDGQTVINNCF